MHGVAKGASTSTKLRKVSDTSACTTSGYSLNDTLIPGPTLYHLLTNILLLFRQHVVGMQDV